jgi:hypothetical protein
MRQEERAGTPNWRNGRDGADKYLDSVPVGYETQCTTNHFAGLSAFRGKGSLAPLLLRLSQAPSSSKLIASSVPGQKKNIL